MGAIEFLLEVQLYEKLATDSPKDENVSIKLGGKEMIKNVKSILTHLLKLVTSLITNNERDNIFCCCIVE